MIEKRYTFSKEKKILKKWAFLLPLTTSNPLKRTQNHRQIVEYFQKKILS